LCGEILQRGARAKTHKNSANRSRGSLSGVSGGSPVSVDSPLAGPVPTMVQTGVKKAKKPVGSAADAKLTSSEEKKQRRIIRNRQAAQLHRDRKARALLDLQTSLVQKESENAILRSCLSKVKSLVSEEDWEMLSREMSSASASSSSSSSSTSVNTDSLSCLSDEERASPTSSSQPLNKKRKTTSGGYSAGGIVKLGMMAGLGLCAMIGVLNSGGGMNPSGVNLDLAKVPGLSSLPEPHPELHINTNVNVQRRKLVGEDEVGSALTTTTTMVEPSSSSYAISPIENTPSLWGTPPWYYSSSHSLYALPGSNSTTTATASNLRGAPTSKALVPARSKVLTNYIYAPTARARIQSLFPAVIDPKRVNAANLEEQLLTILLPSSSLNDYNYGIEEEGWLEMQCKVIEVKEIWDVDFMS